MDDELDAQREVFYDEIESNIRAEILKEMMQDMDKAKSKIQIFLCHASEDKERAMEVYDQLKSKGYKPWIDDKDLLPGQNWREEIPIQLKKSRFALIFFSKNSVTKRGYVQKEFKLALEILEEFPENQIFVIPIRLDKCKIPNRFSSIQYINYFETGAFKKVITSIKKHTDPASPNESGVKIDPTLKLIQGWQNIAKLIEEKIKKLGIDDWLIDIKILNEENIPEEDGALPWPEYFDEERTMKFFVRPESIMNKDIEHWSESIVDFLFQHVFKDQIND